MDKFKQLGKILRKDKENTALNTRNIQINFPMVERKLDDIAGDKSYLMEFPLTDGKHIISLNLKLKPDNCCDCEPGAATVVRDCIAYMSPGFPATGWDNSSFGPPDGTMQQAVYVEPLIQTGTNFNYGYSSPFFHPFYQQFPNIGGYTINPAGGIIVPVDGMYSVLFKNKIETGAGEGSSLTTAILQNGEVISKKVYSVAKGNLQLGNSNPVKTYYQYAVCVALHAGDTVGAGLQGDLNYWIIGAGRTIDNTLRINLLGLGFGTLIGTVKDNVTGLPIQGATVSYSIGFGGSTTTDENGLYEFDNITPGPYSVTVSHAGYTTLSRDTTVVFDDVVSLDFNLTV
jgi:hypothetical protein